MSRHDIVETAIDNLRPIIEQVERRVRMEYEKEISKLRREKESLSKAINENKNYSYQALNNKYIETLNQHSRQIEEYKSTIQKLTQKLSGVPLEKSPRQRSQPDILSYMRTADTELPSASMRGNKNPIPVKVEEESSINVPQSPTSSERAAELGGLNNSSPPARTEPPEIAPEIENHDFMSPTQYSSSQTGSQQYYADYANPKTALIEAVQEENRNSYSIFHGNIDMDLSHDLRDEDDDEADVYGQDEDSPLSQKKRKVIIEDSQKDYEELIPNINRRQQRQQPAQKKRTPLGDITGKERERIRGISNANNRNRDDTTGKENKLDFGNISKIYNLSQNFIEKRDWIIEDFKPNPLLVSEQNGLFTKHQQHLGNERGGHPTRCKCSNCIRFFEASGQPMSLSKRDRFNNLIFKFSHHGNNGSSANALFNFSIDAPGLNISEFPNTQEAKEFKLKAKRINKVKALVRLINCLHISDRTGEQVGLYVFKNETLNQCVKQKSGVAIDDWVYDELESFFKDRDAGLI